VVAHWVLVWSDNLEIWDTAFNRVLLYTTIFSLGTPHLTLTMFLPGVPSIHISTGPPSPSNPVSPPHNHAQSSLSSPMPSDLGSIPPSPALSSHSTNFLTTLNLRDYIPEPAGNPTSISDTDGETYRSPTIRYIFSAAI